MNIDYLKPQRRNDEIEDCGLSSDRIMLKRIIGGNEAKFAEFPWQAHIKIGAYQCGGVLGNYIPSTSLVSHLKNKSLAQYDCTLKLFAIVFVK